MIFSGLLGFCGTYEMMEWISNILNKYYNISSPKISLNGKSKTNYRLVYTGNKAIYLHNKLKQVDLEFRLGRKWDD